MARYDLICKKCGNEIDDYFKLVRDPFPSCSECGDIMERNWAKMGSPGITWKGPGGSPLKGGGPSKPSFNTNEDEVENELYNSITEEE